MVIPVKMKKYEIIYKRWGGVWSFLICADAEDIAIAIFEHEEPHHTGILEINEIA